MNNEESSRYIKSLCSRMFEDTKDEIKKCAVKNRSFEETKDFLFSKGSSSIEVVTNQLFDALLNHVMDQSIQSLEDQPAKIKNAFYDYNLRKIMDEWRCGEFGILPLQTGNDINSKDPRIAVTTWATGSVFVIWLAILLLIKTKSLSLLVVKATLALVSIAATYVISYNTSLDKMHSSLRMDVIQVLDENEKITSKWLDRSIEYFMIKFDDFCTINNIDIPR